MPLKTWVTRPNHPFDSFYFYDSDTLAFVRIRLELGRTDANPDPGVFAKKIRYVAFVEDADEFDFEDFTRWSVNEYNQILYKISKTETKTLSRQPEAGKTPVDFTLNMHEDHPTFIHVGNLVIREADANLPQNSRGRLQ